MKYWDWLFHGSGAGPGIRRFADRWLLVHVIVGTILAWIVPVSLADAANAVLLPLAGIFIGLAFAWGGNAQALLQTAELERFAEFSSGGFEEYAYTYQSAILCVLLTLSVWGLAGLKVFDGVWPTPARDASYFGVRSILFLLASLTVRECWHVVLGAQAMLFVRREIRRIERERNVPQ